MAKWVLNLTWSDVPHLNEDDKKSLLESYSPHERDARSKGIPQLGSGAIFPVTEDDITITPFSLPSHWPRAYGMDVGWKRTAAIFGAYDEKTQTWYLYSEYYRGYAEPSIHADGIRSRGSWMDGVIDPASRSSGQKDGQALLDEYIKLGLSISPANNAVEAGLLEVFQGLSSGRIKVFTTCQNWLSEFRTYRRDMRGKVVKQNDHLMDATRYLIMSGMDALQYPPSDEGEIMGNTYSPPVRHTKGQSSVCGY